MALFRFWRNRRCRNLRCESFRRWLASSHENILLVLTLIAVVLGLFGGFMMRGFELSHETVRLIHFPGEIFMRVLKLMILPLIFSSLISALAQMDARESGQMGLLTLGYYVCTTVLAAIIGIILVLAIHPGDPSVTEQYKFEQEETHISPLDTILDVIRNMFPENVIQASFRRMQTKYVPVKSVVLKNGSLPLTQKLKKQVVYVPGMNVLGIIVFCTGFGIVISQLGERARIIVDFFVILEAVIMKIVETFMWLAPFGIVCLVGGSLLEAEDISDTAATLFMYLITVLLGMFLQMFITLPTLYYVLTRKNPLPIYRGIAQALVTAFGTASEGAALPVSMQCCEDNLKIDRRIVRFVLPLGATINMNGNALYEAVAVIFIAQLNNISLSLGEVATVSLVTVIASLGLNSVPAGLVSILIILNIVGLPDKQVPLIITLDWLLDRGRSVVNILGDAFGCAVVSHFLKKKLDDSDKRNEFHKEIQVEIDLLKSSSSSRRPSETKLYEMVEGTDVKRSVPPSRTQSIDLDASLSWRSQAALKSLQYKVPHRAQNM
uniref:Amino acid transporter n=1 Tax=Acrobeloides nanus TaxID=290746 RepID=A0A914DNE5_9BILA